MRQMAYLVNTNNSEITLPTNIQTNNSSIQLNAQQSSGQMSNPVVTPTNNSIEYNDINAGQKTLTSGFFSNLWEVMKDTGAEIVGDCWSGELVKVAGNVLERVKMPLEKLGLLEPIEKRFDNTLTFISDKVDSVFGNLLNTMDEFFVKLDENIFSYIVYEGKYLQLEIKKASKTNMQPALNDLNERFMKESLPELNAELKALGYEGKEITSYEEAVEVVERLVAQLSAQKDDKWYDGIISFLSSSSVERIKSTDAVASGQQPMTNETLHSLEEAKAVQDTTDALSEINKLQSQIDKLNEILAPYKYEQEQLEFMYAYSEYENLVAQDNMPLFEEYLSGIDEVTFQTELSEYSMAQYNVYLDNLPEKEMVLDYDAWYIENYMNIYAGYIDEKYSNWKIETYYSTENLTDKQALEFFDESEISTYNYIYETEGKLAAQEYLEFMSKELTRRSGQKKAQDYLATLDGSNSDYVNTSVNGFFEGLDSFGTGIVNWVIGDEELDEDDYEQMYILQELSTNETYKPFLEDVWKVSSSVGNMAIPVAVTVAVSIVSRTAGASTAGAFSTLSTSGKILKVVSMAGQLSFGVSAGGNAYDQALEAGNGKFESVLYGIGIATSEMLLEKFLGGIPGLSNSNKNIITSMVSEAGEEWLQTYVETALSCAVLNDDFVNVDWGEKFKEANDAAIYGMLTAGIMNGGTMVIDGVVYTTRDLIFLLQEKNTPTYFKNLNSSELQGKMLEEVLETKDPEMYARYQQYITNNVDVKPPNNDNNSSIEILQMDVATAQKITNNFKSQMTNNSNGKLISNLSEYALKEAQNGNLEPINQLNVLLEIKRNNPNFKIEVTNDIDERSYWNWNRHTIVIGYENIDNSATFFHEFGHSMFSEILNEKFPDDLNNNMAKSRLYMSYNNRNALDAFLQDQSCSLSEIRDMANDIVNGDIKAQYNMTREEYKQYLTGVYQEMLDSTATQEELATQLKALGFSKKQIDSMVHINAAKIADLTIRNLVNNTYSTIIKTERPDIYATSDIINAIWLGHKKDLAGKDITYSFSHSIEYYDQFKTNIVKEQRAFHEIMANFSVLKTTGSEESLNTLRSIIGDEMYFMLEDTYNQFGNYYVQNNPNS